MDQFKALGELCNDVVQVCKAKYTSPEYFHLRLTFLKHMPKYGNLVNSHTKIN